MAVHYFDRLFRRLFSSPETAADLAANVLPDAYVQTLDLTSVRVERGSFVDEDLRTHSSDLLLCFERKGGGQSVYVYLLVDHKSRPDRWVSLQLLRYVGRIYQRIVGKGGVGGRLPEVVPVVFYHGLERWRSPLETADLIFHRGVAKHVPRFRPIFYDIGAVDDDVLHGTVQTVAALLFLKYIRRRFTEAIVSRLLEEFRRLPQDSALLQTFYQAVAEIKGRREIEIFLATAREMRYTEAQEGLMTFAQEMRKEGLQEGKKVGLREGQLRDKQEIVKRQLSRKFGLTEAEAEKIERIEDFAALDSALDEIIDATEKRQVLEKLGL